MSIPDDRYTVPPFGFGVRLGIVFIVESACLSAAAVTSLLLYIAYSAIKLKRGASRTWTVSTHIHYYFVNLLVSDLIQAIGGIMSIKWIVDAGVTEGTLCTAQAIFKQMGDVGVALTSLTIALHTFCVLVFGFRSPPKTAIIVIATIWTFIALIVGLGVSTHRGEVYYGNTQYWCWITKDFSKQRIALEYFWLWLAAFGNIIIYASLFLVVKGIIVVRGSKIHLRGRKDRYYNRYATPRDEGNKSSAIAMQMLFYPAVYIVTVFPISVVRWMAFSGKSVPFPATAFATVLFSSSGLLNVILFKFTRPTLMPNRDNTISSVNSLPNITSGRHRIPTPPRDQGHLPDDVETYAWKVESREDSFTSPGMPPTVHISPSASR